MKITNKEEKCLEEISHFNVSISKDVYFRWMDLLDNNQPLTPEISGYLLGGAKAVFTKVLCNICNKPILIKDKHSEKPNTISDVFGSKLPVHEKCYQSKIKESNFNHL
jgi:hypothetical protein